VALATRQGALQHEESRVVSNVLRLEGVTVSDVMTPSREGHQELLWALSASHTGEAAAPIATIEVACHHLVREPPPEAVPPLEPLLPLPLDAFVERVEKAPKRRLPGVPRPIDATGALHVPPEAGSGRDAGGSRRRTIRRSGG
jgi:hypothetical protein